MISHLLSPKESSSTPKMKISNPERPLDKAVEKSRFEFYCDKIALPLIVLFSVILIALAFVVLLKYGRLWFSTPENHVEHLNEVVLFYGGLYGFL